MDVTVFTQRLPRKLEIGVHVFAVPVKGREKRLDFNSPKLTFAKRKVLGEN